MKKVYLVSKNQGKLLAAKSAFTEANIVLLPVDKDYPEIQADSSLEIARHTAIQAAIELGHPAIREDHSLYIHAINFPGPFTNYMEKSISPKILLQILGAFNDRTGHFQVASVYAEPNGETFEYIFEVPVTFGEEIKGNETQRWDGLIRINNESRALTEYPEKDRLSTWNQGYAAIAKHIKKNS